MSIKDGSISMLLTDLELVVITFALFFWVGKGFLFFLGIETSFLGKYSLKAISKYFVLTTVTAQRTKSPNVVKKWTIKLDKSKEYIVHLK